MEIEEFKSHEAWSQSCFSTFVITEKFFKCISSLPVETENKTFA
jgi:hypothetical protein